MGLISQHQLSTFSSPVNGTSPIDANMVRGNDNAVKTAYNAHDADTTIHLQNGLVASRPAASTAGQMWLASDAGAVYAYLDTGSAWVEVNYLRSTGGTVSGPVTVSDTTDSSSSTTGALIVSGGVGIAKKLYVGTGLTVSAGGINSTGNVIFGADNAYDIGASGANRARNLYLAGTATFGGNVTVAGTISNTQTTTAAMFVQTVNLTGTGTSVFLATEGSAGGTLATGTGAYDVVLGTNYNRPVRLVSNTHIGLTINTDGSVTAPLGLTAGGFGCNGNAAQTKQVSGGTLAGVIAALVNVGILSS